jgi:enoyl-CoA hydratase/carnithine racemase
MAEDLVLREDRGGVRIITLNRPEKMNAATLEMQQRLLAEMQAAAADRAVAVVVLTGAGRAFSAGGDRETLRKMATGDFPEQEAFASNYTESLRTFLSLEKPLIGAANGAAIGWAAGLLSLCDLVVMAEDGQVGDPHVRFGVPCDPAARLMWPRVASAGVAKEMLMTGKVVGAQEALALGLVTRVCPPGEALPAALAIAEELAALPPAGVRLTKRSFGLGLWDEAERVIAALKGE